MVKCQNCGMIFLRTKEPPHSQIVADLHFRKTGEVIHPGTGESIHCQKNEDIDGEFWDLYKQFKDDYSTSRLAVITKDRPCGFWKANLGAYTAKEQDEMTYQQLAADANEKATRALEKLTELTKPTPWYQSGWFWAIVSTIVAAAAILYQVYAPWIQRELGI